MLEKDKHISKQKSFKDKMSKDLIYKEEKKSEMTIQLNYFKRLEEQVFFCK